MTSTGDAEHFGSADHVEVLVEDLFIEEYEAPLTLPPDLARQSNRLGWVARLLRKEGLCLGLSSGINVAGAIMLGRELAAERGAQARVVTILCDTGFRYLSSLYDADWLRSKNLPVFDWLG